MDARDVFGSGWSAQAVFGCITSHVSCKDLNGSITVEGILMHPILASVFGSVLDVGSVHLETPKRRAAIADLKVVSVGFNYYKC